MGMCLGLATLSDADIERVIGDPPLIWRVIAPDDPEMFEQARAAQSKPSLLSRLFGRRSASSTEADSNVSAGDLSDLDKAWHGIHYLLTGSAYEGDAPLDFLVAGGREVGDIDVGYGPARVLTSAETRRVRDALRLLDDETLRSRFDPRDMMEKEIYPEIWDRPPADEDTLGYLIDNLQVLRTFLDKAVAQNVGLVLYLS